MNATVEPATTRQLDYLREHGIVPDHPLSKADAVEIIRSLFANHGKMASLPRQGQGPKHYRERVNAAKLLVVGACVSEMPEAVKTLERANACREDFWMDTCRESSELPHGSSEAWELYRTHGCLFCTPTRAQVQAVLFALDGGFPNWDEERPDLFYETLKLNFPELLRKV